MITLNLLKQKKAFLSVLVFLLAFNTFAQDQIVALATNNSEITGVTVPYFWHEQNEGGEKINLAIHLVDNDTNKVWAGKCPETDYAKRTGDDLIFKLNGTYDLAEIQLLTKDAEHLFQIFISTTATEDYNSATFTKVLPSDNTHLASNTDKTYKSFDLGSNVGTTFVKIKSFGRTGSQWNTYYEIKFYEKGGVASVESNELRQVSLYPTPTNNQLHIKNFNNVVSKIEVFNVLGKKLISNALENNKQTIDTSSLANGMYLVKLSSLNNESSSKMIVIQH